jgi:predicted transcriptional regulator
MRRIFNATDTELSILDVLWNRGTCQVRQIVCELYGRHTPTLHATVKSLLDRLIGKGLVTIDRSEFAHRFSACITREQYVEEHLQQLADSHFNGSLAPMFVAIMGRTKLSRKQRQTLLKIIESID